MNIILRNLSIFLLTHYLCSFSESIGQIDPFIPKYNIDIKKNINNIRTVNITSIGGDVQFLALETSSKCLINEIKNIEFSQSYIFISEPNRLLQFDKSGKFIRQIGSQGRGPVEYLSVGDFCIDETNKKIYIISPPQLLTYDYDGSLIKTVQLPFRPAQIVLKEQNSLMYHMYNIPGKSSSNMYSWLITDSNGKILQSMKNCLKRVSRPGLIVGSTPLYHFNNIVHFMEFGIDTLYYFQNNQKKPYAVFNLENLKMDPDPLINKSNTEQVSKRLFNTFWINTINENNSFLFVKFYRGITDSTMFAVFNKKTLEVTILKDNAIINDLDGGIKFWPKKIVNDNILIDYIDSYVLLKKIKEMQFEARKNKENIVSSKLLKLSKQITETSNPVLMIVR